MKTQSAMRSIWVALLLVLTTSLWAGNISCNWDDHKNGNTVEWNAEKGCFVFVIRYYDYDGTDNHLDWADVYANGSSLFSLHSWHQNDNINPIVFVKYTDRPGSLCASACQGWTHISFCNASGAEGCSNWNATNGWNSLTFPADVTYTKGHYATIYWYPPTETLCNSKVTFRMKALVKNTNGATWKKDTQTTCTSAMKSYQPSTPTLAWENGNPKLSGTLSNGNADKYTRSWVTIQTSMDGKTWYDRETFTITNTTTIPAHCNAAWLSKPSNSGSATTLQQFANGFYFRYKTETLADYGSGYYKQVKYSGSVHTSPLALIKDRNIAVTQNNRDVVVSWESLVPTGSGNKLAGNYVVQRYNESTRQWDDMSTVAWNAQRTKYTYTYTLSDSEINNGDVVFKLRVVRTTDRWQSGEWPDYLISKEVSLTVHTDYKKVQITSVAPVSGQTSATITWQLLGNGIWDNEASLTMHVGSYTGTPAFDDNTFTQSSLASCTSYDVYMEVKVNGAAYQTTAHTVLKMPNLNLRKIENLQVSKGYYSDNVVISWDVPATASDFDYFAITRTAVETGASMLLTQINHSGITSYSYQDKTLDPGTLYSYKVEGYSSCGDDVSLGMAVADYGFSQPYATVSGRISYNGDQAVPGVTVSVTGGEDASQNYSLYFDNLTTSSKAAIKLPASTVDLTANKEYTFQAWIKLDATQLVSKPFIFSKSHIWDIQLQNAEGGYYPTVYVLGKSYVLTDVVIPYDTWTHLSVSIAVTDDYTSASCAIYLDGELAKNFSFSGLTAASATTYAPNTFVVGGNSGASSGYRGYMDELRIWTAVLTEEQIQSTYNALLSGRELNLNTYCRFDENGVPKAFDISGRKGVFNQHDGSLSTSVFHTTDVPSSNQLANKTVTDEDGNYLINTIPYTADGVQYNVTPTLGVHRFSPNKRPIFASPSSLVFNNVDFEDESSFEVSGTVYYEGTNYPVAGAYLYVDGVICSKDAAPIETDEDGHYTINVPIGDHHIEVRMTNHTFAADGRYPADPKGLGLKTTFTGPKKNLDFYDQTKVSVFGRVCGGQIERDKAYGLGLSNANIGQAQLTLSTGYSMNNPEHYATSQASDTLFYASSSEYVASRTYCIPGAVYNEKIIVNTDPATGEWAALLPPVEYQVEAVRIPTNPEISFPSLSNIDATNIALVSTDTITAEDSTFRSFDYVADYVLTYRNNPEMRVYDTGNRVGAFGEKEFVVSDINGNDTIQLYTVAEDGAIDYTYGHPIFLQGNTYIFDIRAYELYTNFDGSRPVFDSVPLQESIVTFANTMSSAQCVYVEDGVTASGKTVHAGDLVDDEDLEDGQSASQLDLDSLGHGRYGWMAGYPNVVKPYTRSLNITYTNEGKTEQWGQNGSFMGIVFGTLPAGNDFVTSGPDVLQMVLRDPPGTSSSSYWEAGSSLATQHTVGGAFVTKTSGKATIKAGVDASTIQGTPGFGVINEISSKYEVDLGASLEIEVTHSNAYTTTIETTKKISTSGDFDYVGAPGDVFIGRATNIIIGDAREVAVHRGDSAADLEMGVETITTAGISYGTLFYYTQNDIENSVLPNLEKARNALLQNVAASMRDTYVNTSDQPIYLTAIARSDERFGSSNSDKAVWGDQAVDKFATTGPSYNMILPADAPDGTQYQDKVHWYNEQIKLWKKTLADNEHAKLTCIANRDKYIVGENISFSAGVTVESSNKTTSEHEATTELNVEVVVSAALRKGIEVNKVGVVLEFTEELTGRVNASWSTTNTKSTEFGYTLQEDGDDDRLTVDVFDYQDGFGPIFVTRAGRTSCPYEGQVMTQYQVEMGYEKEEKEISAATLQIEMPQISAVNPFATDVPTGSPAIFTLQCSNASETDEDCYFDISPVDAFNQHGARIMLDGLPLAANSRTLLVPAGTTITKTLTIEQTQKDVLRYDSIPIVLSSVCQHDPTGIHTPIADTVWLFAEFVAGCSPVSLEVEKRTMNMFTSDTLALVIKDYDVSYSSLRAVSLQYKYKGDVNWTLAREYVVNAEDLNSSNQLLPSGGRIYINYPMSSALFPDGEYQFRAVTTCQYGSEMLYNESEPIDVVKDMARPQVLGTPAPSTGILAAGDDISLTFNEDIRSASLNADNFTIRGVLNGTTVEHAVALSLDSVDCSAITDADIRLADSDWAIEAWMRHSGPGTLFSHGTAANRMTVSIDQQNHLVVDFAGTSIVSTDAIPENKWCFLLLSFTNDTQCHMDATVAYDATTLALFDGAVVPAYTGSGRLQVGHYLRGAIHQLTLWNADRSQATSLSEMYQTKQASTRNLVGYWRMDEGHGTQAADVARARHLNLAAESWYLEQDNLAAHFNGAAYMDLDISTLTASQDDDFLVELWFAGRQQNAACLWSAGQIALGFDQQGLLVLTTGSLETVVAEAGYLDNSWHHLALNVLRNGTATVYVDGSAVKQLSAASVPALQNALLTVGARRAWANGAASYTDYFTGDVDEVRYWIASRSMSAITDDMYQMVSADAPGLMAYYPMQASSLDAAKQTVISFSAADASAQQAGNATMVSVKQASSAPAVKNAIEQSALSYSFVASERTIVISLTDAPARLEASTVSITVQDVRDANGNLSLPITWTAFVHRNTLVWSEEQVTLSQQHLSPTEFAVEISNLSGSAEQWVISGLPTWLTASEEQGQLSALATKTITFAVASATPIGYYEETVYLHGTDDIYLPLVISLTVRGEEPDWKVNPASFENSMNIIGQLQFQGHYSYDASDRVAAFIDETCVGVASPQYYSRYDAYYVVMDVYGTADYDGSAVTFKAYDASTGITYPVVATTPANVTFSANSLVGSIANPLIWNAEDKIEQKVSLSKGWNWTSYAVLPENTAIQSILAPVASSVSLVKDKTSFAQRQSSDWVGTLSDIHLGAMYKINMKKDKVWTIQGESFDQLQHPVTVRSGWNWIGVNTTYSLSLADAFAGLDPEDGDYVKGQEGFAVFQGYEWVGTLTHITPGKGYMYYSTASYVRTFSYPSTASASSALRVAARTMSTFTPVASTVYPGNMTVIARVIGLDGMPAAGVEIGVFAGDECRAAERSDSEGYVFLTIAGGEATPLTVRAVVDGAVRTLATQFSYAEDRMLGTYEAPVMLYLDGVTDLDNADAATSGVWKVVEDCAVYIYRDQQKYDVLGRKVASKGNKE